VTAIEIVSVPVSVIVIANGIGIGMLDVVAAAVVVLKDMTVVADVVGEDKHIVHKEVAVDYLDRAQDRKTDKDKVLEGMEGNYPVLLLILLDFPY